MTHNIAFLTYDWNTEIAGHFAQGIHQYIEEHPGVNVHMFSGFGNEKHNDEYQSSLQIFNLPYLTNYDGVIIQGNHVWRPAERMRIADRAHSYGTPVVSINLPLDGTVNVGSDNYRSSYHMTEHLIVQHHCRTLAVIAGLSSSKEAIERKMGALDCAEKYGIAHVQVYGGEWEEASGSDAVRKMTADGCVPEGIVCGSDRLAFGAETELIAQGYKIPEDVKVTGYDDLSVAAAAPVRITTVNRNYPKVAYTALKAVIALAEGKQMEKEIHPEEDMVYSCSCGCGNEGEEINYLKEKYLRVNREIHDYYKLYSGLSVLLDKARSIVDIASAIEENARAFQSGAMYLVMNGLYMENFGNTNPIRHYGDTMVLIGMSEKNGMQCDDRHVYETFSRQTLLPLSILRKKKILRVYALQAEETCIGYAAVDGFDNQMEFNFLQTILSLLNNAIERVRRASVMESLNSRLSTLYITDPLTGLYNRFGLEQKGRLLYDRLVKDGRTAFICFIDIDDLKKINDLYGHECGDDAIVKISQTILKGLKNTSAFAMRYGGDEFVVIGDSSMKDELDQELKRAEETAAHMPYRLSASVGEFEVDGNNQLTLQKAIEQADDIMYEVKKNKKEHHHI